MTKRTYDVEVPGAPPEVKNDQLAEVRDGADAGLDTLDTASVEESLAETVARLQAENEALRAATAAEKAVPEALVHPSTKFANVHHTKVDKSKISAPVLCQDGWLVP